MARRKLGELEKAYIEKYLTTKTSKEMAKVMPGVGIKTIDKYIDSLKVSSENTTTTVDTPLIINPINMMTNKNGAVVSTKESSEILDQLKKAPKAVGDLRGRVSTINRSRPLPKNVVAD